MIVNQPKCYECAKGSTATCYYPSPQVAARTFKFEIEPCHSNTFSMIANYFVLAGLKVSNKKLLIHAITLRERFMPHAERIPLSNLVRLGRSQLLRN